MFAVSETTLQAASNRRLDPTIERLKVELKYCLVTQNIASVVEDSLTDGDRLPDIELATGDVTFIPNVPTGGSYQIELTNGQWYSVPLGRIRAKIINGKIFHEGKPGVYLYAAGSGSNPSKISYNVSYSNLRAGGIPFSLNSFTFQAVPDEEIDLTLVKPVPGVSPAGTIRGPRGTSLEKIEVDDSHLVFTTVNEAGSFEMARIPISHVVEAEAREAARQAAENVKAITASNLAASEEFKNQANSHATRAEKAADKAVADADAKLNAYVENAKTSATNADASDKSAAAHRAAAKTSETNAKSSETKAKASETKSTTEANRSETARTGSEAAQGKAESAAVKAEGMRDSAATHSSSASRSEIAASKSASNAKASETRAQELADAFDVEALRAEIEARIADLVDGAPDALNTLREIAELASSNKTVQEQLTSAISGKADKVHTHSQSQVTGLTTALGNKADKTHTHETSQVVGLDNALTGKADKAHTHAQSDISGLSTSLSNKADKTHTHSQSQVTGLSTALSGKANTSHEHTTADITDFATEMGKKANSSHTHSQSDVTGLSTALSGKADSSHKHTTADISDFATEMGKKANTSHTHSQSQVTGLSAALGGKADKAHTHAISDVTDLQAELDSKPTHSTMNSGLNGKANKSHTHSQSDITGLSTTLSGKADSTHTHTQGEVTGLTTALNGKAAKTHRHSTADIDVSSSLTLKEVLTEVTHLIGSSRAWFSGKGAPPAEIYMARPGDFWLDEDTMELHKITGV